MSHMRWILMLLIALCTAVYLAASWDTFRPPCSAQSLVAGNCALDDPLTKYRIR
jgi:hypothetical protein